MVYISDIWSIFEAVEGSFEAADSVFDAVEAAGAVSRSSGPRKGRRDVSSVNKSGFSMMEQRMWM